MATGAWPVDSGVRTVHPSAVESSVDEVLDTLLDVVRARTGFRRLVAVAGREGRLSGRALGTSQAELDAFVAACVSPYGSGPRGNTPVGSAPLAALSSWRAGVVVPAAPSGDGFVAAVAVEADPDHPAVEDVRFALQLAVPFLTRGAEVLALRRRVQAMEIHRRRSGGALDALPDPVLVMDSDARTLLSNARADELFVTNPEDSSGRRNAVEKNNLFFSAFRARGLLESARLPTPGELLLIDPTDGSDLMFEVFERSFERADDGTESTAFVLRDITDLSQATTELQVQVGRSVAAGHRARRESERLNIIIGNAGVPIFVTDRQSNVVLMNAEAERLLEGRRGVPGSPPRLHDIQANAARLAGFLSEFFLQPRLRRERRLSMIDPDGGHEFPVSALSTKILDEHDQPTAAVTVLHDLTQEVENRHLAQELRRLNVELEGRVAAAIRELADRNMELEAQRAELARASRMKSEFLATMSHELRTPINAILGHNSLLREGLFGELTEKQADSLGRMRRAAEHLLSLINDILDLSRVEAGKISLNPAEIELPVFIRKLSESVRPMVEEKDLDYVIEVDPAAPTVCTDETRLRQVLLNLLSNAIKFTNAGSVTIRAAGTVTGHAVRIDVIDTGVGIDEGHYETIFEEFTQIDQSETRSHGGTGLGLAISRKLVGLMGGILSVSSNMTVGTTFSVELPLRSPMPGGEEGA